MKRSRSRVKAAYRPLVRGTMAAVALHFTWFGVRKTLSTEQKTQAADTFGAEERYLSASKKLLDTSHGLQGRHDGQKPNRAVFKKHVAAVPGARRAADPPR